MTRKLLIASCLPALVLLAVSGCESTCRQPAADKASPAGTTPEAPVAPKPAPAPPTPPAPRSQPTGLEKAPAFVLRINCGATENYTDKAGNLWMADQEMAQGKQWGAEGGLTIDRGDVPIPGTDAPRLYQLERYSMSAYKFTVPNKTYTVRLHFAETFDGITGDGQRVFSVSINDKVVLPDFDVWKAAGGYQKPLVKEFKGVTVTNGQLVIGFKENVQNPEINAIEILSE
jgi:hypothetical protein